MAYDPENIFAKILRDEIPCERLFENEHALAFRDIRPQAPEHVLVIPKGAYETYDAFANGASAEEIVGFTRAVGEVCRLLGIEPGEGSPGFRMISNAGPHAHQEVPHMHVHVLAGRPLGPLLAPA
jgi:histidine triad (HIT) family protein